VEIVYPADRAEVTLPLTVRWEVREPGVLPEGGAFGVYIDQSPQPPGESQEWFARDDESCVRSRVCPDARYLADRGVFKTTRTSFTIEVLPRTAPTDVVRREFHEFTIAVLDARGLRVGESAWYVDFQVLREGG
jgi:hypothetical protein